MFSVAVTPTSEGTLRLQVPAGATLTDAAGNPMVTSSAIMDDTTITVTAAVPDTTAPTPNPMSFATAPYATSATSIAMEASPPPIPRGSSIILTRPPGTPAVPTAAGRAATATRTPV